MTTDFRALCAELVDELNYHADEHSVDELISRARAALATPPPEPPVDGEVAELAALIRQCALAWEPDARLLGNMTAAQLARAAELLERTATPPPEAPTDEEIQEWADSCSEAPLEEMDYRCHVWQRRFEAEEFSKTIRAALERWGR